MTNARATRGTAGNILICGFDTQGAGIQVDQSSTYSSLIQAITPSKKWQHLHLVNLINSNNDKLHRLAKHLEYEGYKLTDECYYNHKKNVYFIHIKNREFRIKKDSIVELTSNMHKLHKGKNKT